MRHASEYDKRYFPNPIPRYCTLQQHSDGALKLLECELSNLFSLPSHPLLILSSLVPLNNATQRGSFTWL